MSTNSLEKTYYPFLDGFRAIAILWVTLHHIMSFYPSIKSVPFLGRITEIGFIGVDIFFVISGFLITGLLIDDLNDSIRIKRFYIRRFFKIVPHYLTIVLTVFIISALSQTPGKTAQWQLASYLVFLQNYIPPIPELAHLWSLAIEEHFYLLYALLLVAICKSYRLPSDRHRTAILCLIFLIILGNYIRYAFFEEFPPPYSAPVLFQQTHMRFDALIMGCLIKFLEHPIKQFALKGFNYLCSVLTGILFAYLYFQYDMYHWYSYTAAYFAAGCLIIAALIKDPVFTKIGEQPYLRWIGKNSYGIYLWHYPIAQLFNTFDLPPLLSVFLYVSISIYLGYFTTRTIENYFLRVRKNLMP